MRATRPSIASDGDANQQYRPERPGGAVATPHDVAGPPRCELWYGRPGGRPASVVAPYAPGGERLVVAVGGDDKEQWQHVFATRHPVRVWMDGRWRPGLAWILVPGHACWHDARDTYQRCYPDGVLTDRSIFLAVMPLPPTRAR